MHLSNPLPHIHTSLPPSIQHPFRTTPTPPLQIHHTPLYAAPLHPHSHPHPGIPPPQHLPTDHNMIIASKQPIHLLQHDQLGLREKQPHEQRQPEIDAREHVEGVEAAVLQEDGEELLADQVGDVLGLRGHADGLGAHVDGEDLRGVDPDCGAPGGFV